MLIDGFVKQKLEFSQIYLLKLFNGLSDVKIQIIIIKDIKLLIDGFVNLLLNLSLLIYILLVIYVDFLFNKKLHKVTIIFN